MKRALIVAVALIAFGGLLWAPASVAAPQGCTKVGTAGRDMMAGTRAHDKLCSLAGGDYVHADGKGDIIAAGPGNDTAIGGGGRDRIKGGVGNDKLFSVDQVEGNDVVRGGPGFDQCYADFQDQVLGCEAVHRSNSPATTQALSGTVFGVASLGEQLQQQVTPTPTPTSPGSSPPCVPPPFATDPPCV